MARIFCVGQEKGGTGKSTTTILLAGALSVNYGQEVLVIDSDAQQTITDIRTMEMEEGIEKFPYQIISASHQELEDVIAENYDKYDFIFVDMPRMTGKDDDVIVETLANCDSMLIPITASQPDTLSTGRFMRTVKMLGSIREKEDLPFHCHAFINMKDSTRENDDIPFFAEQIGISLFNNAIKRKKLYKQVSTATSILSNREGKKEFEPFMTEFIERFQLGIALSQAASAK